MTEVGKVRGGKGTLDNQLDSLKELYNMTKRDMSKLQKELEDV